MAYRDQLLPVNAGGSGTASLTSSGWVIGSGTSPLTATTTPSVNSISFGGTSLDAYVEGTFTPIITLGGGTTGITYSTQSGKYTQIGNLVYFDIKIVLTSKGTDTGALTITGYPFASGGFNSYLIVKLDNVTFTGAAKWVAATKLGTTVGGLAQFYNNGGSNGATDANLANNSEIYISGTYISV